MECRDETEMEKKEIKHMAPISKWKRQMCSGTCGKNYSATA